MDPKMEVCHIKFYENPLGIYFTGQKVSGLVHLELKTSRWVKSIKISFEGEEKTLWDIVYRDKGAERNRKYLGLKTHLDHEEILKSAMSDLGVFLEPGVHKFYFSYTLPEDLPPSFEGSFGYVRYRVFLTLDRPRLHQFKSFVRRFTVLRQLDVDCDLKLQTPVTVEGQKNFKWSVSSKGSIHFSVSVPKTIFGVNEKLPLTIDIRNDSSVDVLMIWTRLILKAKFVAFSHEGLFNKLTKSEKRQVKGGVITSGAPSYTRKLYVVELDITAIPTTNEIHCKYIKVFYKLEVELELRGFNSNVKFKIPVTIGAKNSGTDTQYSALPSFGTPFTYREYEEEEADKKLKEISENPNTIEFNDIIDSFEHDPSEVPIWASAVHFPNSISGENEENDQCENPPAYDDCVR